MIQFTWLNAFQEFYYNFDWETDGLNHPLVPAVLVCFYLTSLLILDHLYHGRKNVKMPNVIFFHNTFLCLWSLIMLVGCIWECYQRYIIEGNNWEFILCEQNEHTKGPLYFWSYIFWISKWYELGDTMLQMYRGKRPYFLFLHVYHHATVLVGPYYWLQTHMSMQAIALILNSFVHVWMYGYYALRCIGIHPWWKNYITYIQLIQFIVSIACFYSITVNYQLNENVPNCQGYVCLCGHIFFDVTMFILFCEVLWVNLARNKKQGMKKKRS